MFVPIVMSLISNDSLTLKVGDLERTAVVSVPEVKGEASSVVFVFHGHGGTAKVAQRAFAIERHWPEALVIYPQGLPTPTQRDPEGKRNGWNARTPAENRDIAFFDALLNWAKKTHGAKRVFVTGHSNGGGFTYLLATERGEALTAVAPSSAGPSRLAAKFPLIPVMHLGGEKDEIVPFSSQERMVAALRDRLSLADVEPKTEGKIRKFAKGGGPEVQFFVHPGGHSLPVDAYPAIAEFFKRLS